MPPAQCHKMIPPALIEPTKGADIPQGVTAKEWQLFGLEQSVQLEKANNDKPSIVYIVKSCEDLMNQSRPRKKFLGIF